MIGPPVARNLGTAVGQAAAAQLVLPAVVYKPQSRWQAVTDTKDDYVDSLTVHELCNKRQALSQARFTGGVSLHMLLLRLRQSVQQQRRIRLKVEPTTNLKSSTAIVPVHVKHATCTARQ
jgi:hypothetical protein